MSDIENDKPETLTITIEFPRGVKLTRAQKEYLSEEAARRVGALIQTMTFIGEKPIDEMNNAHKTRGQDEQE